MGRSCPEGEASPCGTRKGLEIERLKQEQKLDEFKLKRELELRRAKLSVCKETDNE